IDLGLEASHKPLCQISPRSRLDLQDQKCSPRKTVLRKRRRALNKEPGVPPAWLRSRQGPTDLPASERRGHQPTDRLRAFLAELAADKSARSASQVPAPNVLRRAFRDRCRRGAKKTSLPLPERSPQLASDVPPPFARRIRRQKARTVTAPSQIAHNS